MDVTAAAASQSCEQGAKEQHMTSPPHDTSSHEADFPLQEFLSPGGVGLGKEALSPI